MAKVLTEKSNYEDIADAIREKTGTGETYLPSEMAGAIRSIHGDVTGVKGDSESNYRTGNVNLTPANIGAKATQAPVSSPSASGTAVEFIDSITQNAQGVITPTKKTVRTATASQSGLMSAVDKGNLDDLKTRMTAVEDEMDILAIYPTASGKGAMVTIEGTVDAPPAEMVIYGKSVQSGTPSPSSPAAIVTAGSGGTLPMVSVAAGTNIHNSATDTAQFIDENGNITDNADYLLTDYIPLSGNYLFIQWENVVGTACYLRRAYYDSNKSFIRRDIHQLTQGQSGTFWTPLATARYVRICVENSSTNRIYGLQVHDGYGVAIDTTPNGLPGIPVASGGNYTDTNGQMWICDTIDFKAGTRTKRCGIVSYNGQSTSGWERVNAANSKYRFRNTSLTSTIMKAATNDTIVPLLCTHYTNTSANATWTNTDVDGITVDTGGNVFIADADLCDAGTLEQLLARFQATAMTIVYPMAVPVVEQLTTAQLTALRSLRGRKGQTYMYSIDQEEPEFQAEMYIDIPTYIQSVIGGKIHIYNLNITPGTWNNIHPDFDPETEEYAVTLRKGNAATVNAVVIGTTATVTFDTIGGARTYFTMSTSSSAVGDRKTYSCEVNPFAAGVGGGLVMSVTKGNLSRRYYLSITSVE